MTRAGRRIADVAVAALAAGLMLLGAALSEDEPARPFDGVLVAAVVAVAAWTALARHAPRTALVGAAATYYLVLVVEVPAFTPALALGVPLFVVATAGHLRWAASTVAVVAVTGLGFRLFEQAGEPVAQVLFDTLIDLALMTLVVLLGDTLRSRRAAREEAALRVALAQAQQAQRLADERLRIARDLHDVLAHTLTVVGIQAGVAAESLEDERDGAREGAHAAVGLVRSAVADAMADLRGTISLLRAGNRAPDVDPAPTLTGLPDLVDRVRRAGVAATLTVHGPPSPLRPAVEVTGYRVVQESLTNVLRHARARAVAVEVVHGADAVTIDVLDDGDGALVAGPAGAGLHGMTERVGAVGGTVRAAPRDGGRRGFAVRVRLPAGGPS